MWIFWKVPHFGVPENLLLKKKVAVLNFANPHEPGGGVLREATAFHKLLIRDQYAKYFKEVKFAIKRTGEFCENLCAFETVFETISAEGNKRRFWM